MAPNTNETFIVVRNEDGETYLCPINSIRNRDAVTDDEMDSCVERDIVERYSGNIKVEQ